MLVRLKLTLSALENGKRFFVLADVLSAGMLETMLNLKRLSETDNALENSWNTRMRQFVKLHPML